MGSWSLRSRGPTGAPGARSSTRDRDRIASHLEDAAHFPGGHAPELVAPASEADVAETLRRSTAVLPIGAQSSLTGGATPMGETILSTARLNNIEHVGSRSVRVQPGVTLMALAEALAGESRCYPPVPTFSGAFVGGIVSTNAAGAATFKYGPTRRWVEAITVVLAGGEVLDIERGATRAHPGGYFELDLAGRQVRVPVPTYRMPAVPKLSAGYFAESEMDLIDLFIGSEGTLGVITNVTLRVLPETPASCLAFVTFRACDTAIAFARQVREQAIMTWQSGDPSGIDVAAIEHMDRRSLALVRENGLDRLNHVTVPADAAIALLITLELPPGQTSERVYKEIGRLGDADAPDSAIVRFCRLLSDYDALDRTEIAGPDDHARRAQFLNLREAVPAAVNQRIAVGQREIGPLVQKTAADIVVPFDRLESLLGFCEAEAARRNLDLAIWGHLSDGNVHPNVIPRTSADLEAGREAVLAFGREAIRLGGAPLAEHGVGRNRIKQQLLLDLYGNAGVDEMRRVKAALDPEWKLAPGVIFPRT